MWLGSTERSSRLKKKECCSEIREELRRALGGSEELPDDWDTTAEVLRETVKKVLTVLFPLSREREMRKYRKVEEKCDHQRVE